MKQIAIAALLFLAKYAGAQNVGIGTFTPNINAKLDITAVDKGLLIPRMDSVHRKAIDNTIGLLVFDSTTKSFWYNDGTAWQNMAAGWSLTGNSRINPNSNFLGTNDNSPLVLRFNGQPAGLITGVAVSFGSRSYSAATGNTSLTAIGAGALQNNEKNSSTGFGDGNTAVGINALNQNTRGSGNTATGANVLQLNTTGARNTAYGYIALGSNSTGDNNTANGNLALFLNTTGVSNTAVGQGSMLNNITGSYNTGLGTNTLRNSTGTQNTAIGHNAFAFISGVVNNTALGYQTELTDNSISNATAIGANAKVDASNKIRLGDGNVTVVESNAVFNTVSDGRFKFNIRENVKGLDFILQLRPVTFQFDIKKQEDFSRGFIGAGELSKSGIPAAYTEANAIRRTGFVAQEVETAAKKARYDFDGLKAPASERQYYSLSYASFVVPLVKAVQEQEQLIEALQSENVLLLRQNAEILKRLDALEKKK